MEVMREVKSLILPTTLDEKVCTPVVMDLVKSAPGTLAGWAVETGAMLGAVEILPKDGS